jgi:ABC-2 type transport system permease protein
MRCDLYKLHHSGFFVLHLVLPLVGAAVTLLFAGISHSDAPAKWAAFCQFMAMAFPFMIAIACHVLVEQEARAGRFQHILSLPNRTTALLSKLTVLLVSGFAATLWATVLFGFLFPFVSGTVGVPVEFYTIIPLVLWGSQIFLYAFHLLIAMRFGKNLGIGLGGVGSLLATLLYTGLGSGLWYVIPYGWGIRFSMYALEQMMGVSTLDPMELRMGLIFYGLWTCVMIAILLVWFSRYNGNRSAD